MGRVVRSLALATSLAGGLVACGTDAKAPAPAVDPATVDLALLVDQFRPLVDDPSWKVKVSPMSADELAWRSREELPPDSRAKYLEGYREGLQLAASGDAIFGIAIMRFDGSAHAAAHVSHQRAAVRKAIEVGEVFEGAVVGEGAGPDGRVAGFTLRQTRGDSVESALAIQQGNLGPFVFSVLSDAPWLDRATIDAAIARLEAAIEDPDAARAAERPAPVPVPASTRTSTSLARAPPSEATTAPPGFEPPEQNDVPAIDRDVTVHVVAPDGSPVPIFEAMIHTESTSSGPTTFKGGTAVLSSRGGTGKTTVRVWGSADASDVPFLVAPVDRVLTDDEREITIRLEPGVEITGDVVQSDGSAATSIQVVATTNDRLETEHARVNVDVKGRFRIVGLDRREYRLTTADLEHRRVSAPVIVAGGVRGVSVRVVDPVNVTLRIVDENGRPVGSAVVALSRPTGPHTWTGMGTSTASDAGVVEIARLVPGLMYLLDVSPPPGRDDLLGHRDSEWTPHDDTLVLARVFSIRGVVRDAKGAPLSGARVAAFRVDGVGGRIGLATADELGRFELRELPFAPHSVAVLSVSSGRTASSASVLVDPEKPGAVELIAGER